MKKVTFLIFLFLFVGATIQLNAGICECGDYENGITTYTVFGDDCCTGKLTGINGTQTTWIKGQGGTWRVLSTTSVAASVARTTCCDEV